MNVNQLISTGLKAIPIIFRFVVNNILPEAIGLFSAIVVAYFTKWRFENKDNISMLNQLLEELKKTYYNVEMFIKEDEDKQKQFIVTNTEPGYYINPYPVSMWNVSIQTGRILNMLSYKYSKDYYQRVIETYGQILEANQTETLFYKMKFEENAFDDGQMISLNYQNYLRLVRRDLLKRVDEEIKELEKIKEIK